MTADGTIIFLAGRRGGGDCNILTVSPLHPTVRLCCLPRSSPPAGRSRSTLLTPKVLVATIDAQWEGMGDVGLARYEPALLPPCPTLRVLSYSN